MKRALTGLALFVCLTASGWAWMRFTAPLDVTGTYYAPWNSIDTGAACAPGAEIIPGVMRVAEDTVSFTGQTCQITGREDTVEETAEGPSTTVTMQLVCSDDPAGPEGQDATLWSSENAQITTFVPAGGDYVEAHAMYLSCADRAALAGRPTP